LAYIGSKNSFTGSQNDRWYDRRGVVLYAFLVGLTASVLATAFVVVRGIRLWRHAKSTGGMLSDELASFEERSARAERLLAEADRSNQDLEAALGRLRASRARLDVLLGSVQAAQQRTRWLRAFLPVR